MISVSTLFYIIVTLTWVAIASFIIIRVPKCKTVPQSAQVFIIIFLLLQILSNGHQLYEILVKENIIHLSNTNKTNIVSNKETLTSLSNLLLGTQWFNLLSFIFMIILYYILFRAVQKCNEPVIGGKLLWSFIIVTMVQYFSAATMKSTTENKLLLSAMATK